MSEILQKLPSFDDVTMLKLVREIAMDFRSIDEILEAHRIPREDFELLRENEVFLSRLRSAIEEWNSATNTPERVRLKSLFFVEEALPEFYARAHDPKEGLAAKVEILKTIAKFGGVGGTVEGAVTGERMTVTINLGADHNLRIEKDITPTIEGDRL